MPALKSLVSPLFLQMMRDNKPVKKKRSSVLVIDPATFAVGLASGELTFKSNGRNSYLVYGSRNVVRADNLPELRDFLDEMMEKNNA
jgi:hypothetical protein